MDEKKLESLEAEVVEETVEAVEEVNEEIQESVEADVVEEAVEETIPVQDADTNYPDATAEDEVAEAIEYVDEQEDAGKKKSSVGKIAAIVASAIVVLVAAAVVCMATIPVCNPYNMKYANTTGRTIADIAEEQGYTLKEFKELANLPSYMPGTTYENAANMSYKIKTFIEKSGLTMDRCREYYGWGDDITEETPLGEAIDKTTLLAYCGGEQQVFADFKEYYGLGDEITGDTLYGDVRKTIEEKEIEILEQKEKEEAETAK